MSVIGRREYYLFVVQKHWNFNGSNIDGSFTTPFSDSFLNP